VSGSSSSSSSSSSGSSGSSGVGGTGGAAGNAGAAGSSGAAGRGSSAGGGGTGGSSGTGGTGGGAGNAGAGGSAGSADASVADAPEAGPVSCADENIGADAGSAEAGTGDAGTAKTAIVLIDGVVMQDATNTVVAQWQFNDASTIAEGLIDPRPGDKWSRVPYSPIAIASGASNTFLACAGNPAAGSMKEVIPFTDAAQYYEVSVLFAEHDYSNHHVSAKVKLVTGGISQPNCPGHAMLYAVNGGDFVQTPASPITLIPGQWHDIALTIPATGFTRLLELGVRITTYVCQ